MKYRQTVSLALASAMLILMLAGCAQTAAAEKDSTAVPSSSPSPKSTEKTDLKYSTDQAMSDKAQLSTIAFSGLAFITGSSGADTFFPPGKVADFFGFQYMRDIDTAGYGHNTQFLSRVANNVLYILTDDQKAELTALAREQAPLYLQFAYNRLPLINAFRRDLEGNIPAGTSGLDQNAVKEYTASLYSIDAEMSCGRAETTGAILQSLTEEQKAYLDAMAFDDFNTWPDVPEDTGLKTGMTNSEFVCVMTYASEMFSWYKGSVESDAYFCPERHGTYFGGFFMKDYNAMNNPDYFISTSVTGDKGQEFLDLLDEGQRKLIEEIIPAQKDAITEIASIRRQVSTELRKALAGQSFDEQQVSALIKRYGELDGTISGLYAQRFAEVNRTLTDEQRTALVKLRDLDAAADGTYLFSALVKTPELPDTDFFFGAGTMPADAGVYSVPDGFGTIQEQPKK